MLGPMTLQEQLESGLSHHQSGRLAEAEKIYRDILSVHPNHAEAMHFLGVVAGQAGRWPLAVELISRAIMVDDNVAAYHSNLGLALKNVGRIDEAIAAFRRAISLDQSLTQTHSNLGNSLRSKGDLEQAVEAFRRAIELNPESAPAHRNLGSLLKERGDLDGAISVLRRAAKIDPKDPSVHYDLGNALHTNGQLDEAIASFRRVIQLKPDLVEGHNNLGAALEDAGQLNEAIASYRQAIRLAPGSAEPHYNLGHALERSGQAEDAIASYRQAIRLKPDLIQAYNNLGNAWHDLGRLDEAIASFRTAIRLKPDYVETYYNLGNALHDGGGLDEAIACFGKAIGLKPDSAEAHSNLGRALRSAGQLDEAIAAYREAIRFKPDLASAHSNLICALQYHPGCDADAINEELRRWNQVHAQPLRKFILPHTNDRNPDRRLRIGYVSADFREHSVSWFLLPLIREHDHGAFEIFCYSDVLHCDAVTDRLRACVDGWQNIVRWTDERVAEKVREDKIDILVDLAGHTAGNRLRVFALKPAPVQVSYLGYSGTTGLPEMDYRLTDSLADPPGKTESFHTEKLVRLPVCNWCFGEPDEAPPVGPLPAESNGSICFGTFNNFGKASPAIMDLWAAILIAAPLSRLIIKSRGLGEQSIRERIHQNFASRGVPADRLEIRGHEPNVVSHLNTYNRMDIALDTFPYHGTTTTCEALWMGVPVVTLAGSTHISRVGVSLLSSVGLPELIAQSAEEYLSIATGLAKDLPRLAELRRTLRQRMRASPLMDGRRFARDIEAAYRQMWRNWCGDTSIQQQFESGKTHHSAGRFAEAEKIYRQVLAQQPNHADALHSLGLLAASGGQMGTAVELIGQAVRLKPDDAVAQSDLGAALKGVGRTDEAIASLQKAVGLKPDLVDAQYNLGNALKDARRLDESIVAYHQAIRLKPDYGMAHNNLGNVLMEVGRLDDAVAAYRRATALGTRYITAHDNLIYSLHFHPAYDAQSIAEEHRRWNHHYADPLRKFIQAHSNERSPDRRLRIGYVGADFREHCQSLFTIPLLSNHDRKAFEIFCYSNVARPDDTTERIGRLCDGWLSIVGMTDQEVGQKIREDRIDILVDLTLHMANNRMPLFARKPAPVQVTWLGYPGTTGLATMDYRLTDPYLDPPGYSDQFCSETSIRLPDTFWCYDPLNTELRVNDLPAQSHGFITFGSLNNFCKVTERVPPLWAQVLKTVDRSRLMILCPEGSHRQPLLNLLQREGIDPNRIELFAHRPRATYLEHYHRIDVGLDTFPVNGHTTSLDSYWMGVPVVTLAGNTILGRAGLSQLTNLGLTELIARTPQEYVQIAAKLANDLPRLAELRRTLRPRMQASPLMDAPRFARNVEAAYRQMWRNWCTMGK
jgi:predicted O-linked N-acetylglucosamine transferase (SPINDLY family)